MQPSRSSLRGGLLRFAYVATTLLAAMLASAAGDDVGAAWLGRSVYFVVTDRFNRGALGAREGVCAGKDWCGGTLRGVTAQLDYIHSMGFDAIWITPVVKQVPWRDRWNGTGYHGYWAQDFFRIDPHLGTSDDLKDLKKACTRRGMLLMLDVVVNHVGPLHTVAQIRALGPRINNTVVGNDGRLLTPQLHTLRRRGNETLAAYLKDPATMMEADHGSCWPDYMFGSGCNYTYILDGWFGDLGDLRHEHPATSRYLLEWIEYMVTTYEVDGIRLDTALYVPQDFLRKFQRRAGVLVLGELVMYNMSLHRSFVAPAGPLSSLLNFPITEHLKYAFSSATEANLSKVAELLREQASLAYPREAALLGNFVDNHDSPRFLWNHSNEGAEASRAQLRNALALTMLWQGIPIVYYGTEKLAVANASDARVSMWGHGPPDARIYDNTTATARFLTEVHRIRAEHGLGKAGDNVTSAGRIVTTDQHTLGFVRGRLLVIVSNVPHAFRAVTCIKQEALPPWWSSSPGSAVRLQLTGCDGPAPQSMPNGTLCVGGPYPAVISLS